MLRTPGSAGHGSSVRSAQRTGSRLWEQSSTRTREDVKIVVPPLPRWRPGQSIPHEAAKRATRHPESSRRGTFAEVAERVSPSTARLEPDGPDRCVLTSGADDLSWLTGMLLGLGHELDVLDPPELRASFRDTAARLQRASAGPDPSG